jgi:hypothetical protein
MAINTKQLKPGAVVEFRAAVMPNARESHIAEINAVTTTLVARHELDYWGRRMHAGYDEVPAYEMVGWRGLYTAADIIRVVKPAPALHGQPEAVRTLAVWSRAAGWGTPSPDALRQARSLTLSPERVSSDTWRVPSQRGTVAYTVRVALDAGGQVAASCSCADAHAGHHCKHARVVERIHRQHGGLLAWLPTPEAAAELAIVPDWWPADAEIERRAA